MAVGGAPGDEWDTEEVENCGLGGQRNLTEPGSGTSWRKRERESERAREKRGAGGREETNRLPWPRPGRTARVSLGLTGAAATAAAAHSLFIRSLSAPSPVK